MTTLSTNTELNLVQRIWNSAIDRLESKERIDRTRYAFLPAALEIQETPPSPVGRAINWTIMLLFVAAVTWACIGQMDVVATAQGKIIPGGRIKTVQPVELGKVKTLHVGEGQRVIQGDPLITLDGTSTKADVDRLQNQLRLARLEVSRIKQLHELIQEDGRASQASIDNTRQSGSGVLESESITQQRLLAEQFHEYISRKNQFGEEISKLHAEQARVRATIRKLERTLPLVSERVVSLETLVHKHMVARDKYLELEQERIEQEQDLYALRAQSDEIIAAIKVMRSQRDTLKAEAMKQNLVERNNTEKQIAATEQELVKARQRHRQQVITAPVSGTVQQLAIHTEGGVVTPAQELMQIVPSQIRLEVEAMILNKDIGFVEEGQLAEVKVDTFNFTRYGTVDAQIENISNDAIEHDQMGLVYAAKVLIKKTQMQINERLVKLSPGMAVTVEVKTGKRRIIEYFLSPLLRYKRESIRER